MKHDWIYNTISEVCTKITDGSHNPPKGIPMSEYLMISSQNVFDDKLDFTDVRYLSKESFELENKRTRVSAGDVLLTIVGTIGRCCVVPENVERITLQRSVAVISPKAIIKPRFLMYCLRGQRKSLLREGHGIAQKGLYLKRLQKIVVPVPPLPVQEQICSLLDKMNRVIEAKKEQLKELDKLAQAIFYDMFGDPTVNDKGWEKQKLGDCFSYIKNGANIKQDKSQIGFPITRIETLSNGVFNRDRMGYAGITDKTKYEQYILQDKDLLMSHINSKAYIGRTVLYRKKEGEVFIHGMNLLRLVPLPLLDSEFFCYLAKTDYVKEKIASIRKDAVNQSSLAISDLKKIDIPIPPLSLQQSFAEKVKAIERQKELINQSIKDVQTLFDAKMDYYFGD